MALQIGNYAIGDWGTEQDQYNPKLTFDVALSMSKARAGVETLLQPNWTGTPPTQAVGGMMNFDWVQSRFSLATEKAGQDWTYGAFLFYEEMWAPGFRSLWPGGLEGLTNWPTDGIQAFAGVSVMHLKPWYESIYGAGSWAGVGQKWWDVVKTGTTTWYTDPVLVRFSGYYIGKLLDAWHTHMHNLNKKSAIVGLVGITVNPIPNIPKGEESSGIFYFEKPDQYPAGSHLSALKYDCIVAYQYPTAISGTTIDAAHRPVSQSVQVCSKLRNQYGYKGKLVWILTSRWPGNVGTDDIAVQEAEYKAVKDLVDVVLVTHKANMMTWPGTILNPPRLIKFYENNVVSPPPKPVPVLSSIVLTSDSTSIRAGENGMLKITCRDQFGELMFGNVGEWGSSDSRISTVSQTGILTGLKAGSVIITATSAGISGHITITVLEPEPPAPTEIDVTARLTGIQSELHVVNEMIAKLLNDLGVPAN